MSARHSSISQPGPHIPHPAAPPAAPRALLARLAAPALPAPLVALPPPAGPVTADAYARAEAIVGEWSRSTVAALLELLVDRLDAAEPDPDLEPEPDGCAAGDDDLADFARGGTDDPYGGEREPSLGWNADPDQSRIPHTSCDDAEPQGTEDEPEFVWQPGRFPPAGVQGEFALRQPAGNWCRAAEVFFLVPRRAGA